MNKSKVFFFVVLVSLLTFLLVMVYADGNAQRIREILYRCEQETGVSIRINNGDYDTRSVRRQAELMADMSASQRSNLYGNNGYTQAMARVTAVGTAKIDEFEQIINRARAGGYDSANYFISRHLTGDAVDIFPPSTAEQKTKVKNWLENNGVTVLNEINAGINCWHLQLR